KEFATQVENLADGQNAHAVAAQFDDEIRRRWPLAEVGFCVTLSGKLLSPSPNARAEAKTFCLDNSGFLANREPVEVYWSANAAGGANNFGGNTLNYSSRSSANQAPAAPSAVPGSSLNKTLPQQK